MTEKKTGVKFDFTWLGDSKTPIFLKNTMFTRIYWSWRRPGVMGCGKASWGSSTSRRSERIYIISIFSTFKRKVTEMLNSTVLSESSRFTFYHCWLRNNWRTT